jgi:SAM-dependent methyltransferase
MSCYQEKMLNITHACSRERLSEVKLLPFEVRICTECKLGFSTQNLSTQDQEAIYDQYAYTSAGDGMGRERYEGFLELLRDHFSPKAKLLELGCFDGYLLLQLKKGGFSDLRGIEPSPAATKAVEAGLDVQNAYFDENSMQGKILDGIFAMHVFEHFGDPSATLLLMKSHLKEGGRIVLEVPNFCSFHHEHLFYFSPTFLKRLANDHQMALIKLEATDDVIRFVLEKSDRPSVEISSQAHEEIARRARAEMAHLEENTQRLSRILNQWKGEPIYWWGSGLASIRYLNQIDSSLMNTLDLKFLDGQKDRWGLFIPGLGIEIESYENLRGKEISNLVIGSSFHEEIKSKLKSLDIRVRNIEVFF